jgi:Family of unknown function (DUF5335)
MMATERELATEMWSDYFASIARTRETVLASVAVTRERANGSHEPMRPLRSISYDVEDDVLEIAVGPKTSPVPVLRYFIAEPRRIEIDGSGDSTVIVIDAAAGVRSRISLQGPPRLRLVSSTDRAPRRGMQPDAG